MSPWSLTAIACLMAAGVALVLAQRALVESHDAAALYWLVAGAVTMKASFALAEAKG